MYSWYNQNGASLQCISSKILINHGWSIECWEVWTLQWLEATRIYSQNHLVGHQSLISIGHLNNKSPHCWHHSPKQKRLNQGISQLPICIPAYITCAAMCINYIHNFPTKIHQEIIIQIIGIHMHSLIRFVFLYVHPKYPQQLHNAYTSCLLPCMGFPPKVEQRTKKNQT